MTRLEKMTNFDATDNWRPTAALDVLRQRGGILRRIRQFFDERGFLEVETPLLSSDSVIDRYLDPFEISPDQTGGRPKYLQTSPEFGMKRLLAAGIGNIYQITRAFRREEAGSHHNPEFTMLEWYEVGADYAMGIQRLADLAAYLFPGREVRQTAFAEALARHVGLDPWRAADDDLRERIADALPGDVADLATMDRDNLLNVAMARLVQPHLGEGGPEIIYDWPASQAALARLRFTAGGITVAERFELYVGGIELANGYHELLDADELVSRGQRNNAQRVRDDKRPLPEENRLIAAMRSGLPACSGTAVGVDRLVMAILGLTELRQVIPFPFERA